MDQNWNFQCFDIGKRKGKVGKEMGAIMGKGKRKGKEGAEIGMIRGIRVQTQKALCMHAFCHNIMRFTCQYLALLPPSTTKMLMLNPLKVLILSVLNLIYRLFPVE